MSSGGRKSSPAVRVATVAVALSVIVMFAAISIVLGFRREILNKLVGFNADLTLQIDQNPESELSEHDNIIILTPTLRSILENKPYIRDISVNLSAPAILKTHDDFKGVYFKTLDGSSLKNLLASSLEEGELPAFIPDPSTENIDSIENQILVSRIAADRLGLSAGDRIDVYFITDDVRVRRLKVSGIFNTHFDTYDDIFVFGSPALLRSLNGLRPEQGTQLSIVTVPGTDVEEARRDLQFTLVNAYQEGRVFKPYRVESVRSSSGSFFQWLELLDMNVIIIISLMTFVAVSTLISGMLIIIIDKKRFIALMKALGTPAGRLRIVFVYIALRIALKGMIIGDIIGLFCLWLQDSYHMVPLDADAYYIDFVPVEISWITILLLNLGVLLVSYLVLILPARFIGSVSPSSVLSEE